MHRSLSDVHDLLHKINQFLQTFTPNYIVTGDGKKVETLTRTEIGLSTAGSLWFSVTNTSEGDTFTVSVNEGRILAPDTSGIGSDPPVVTGLLKEYTVDGVTDLEVEDGSLICLKLTVTHPAAATFEPVGEDDDFVSVTVTMDVHRFYSTTGEIVAITTIPEPTATTTHITLAEIKITDGVMTIKQRHDSAITVPAIITPVLKTVSVTSALTTANHWTCDVGTAEEVTFIVPS